MQESNEIMERLVGRLSTSFGTLAPQILQVLVDELGGVRFTFPDLVTVQRMERNRMIRNAFNGLNTTELAIRHGLTVSQIRRIVNG